MVPLQYSERNRRVGYFAGFFFGKDHRGRLHRGPHRVPLMSRSAGVVMNRSRHFTRGTEVSELVMEMKGGLETLPGSVWAVGRRHDEPAGAPASGAEWVRDEGDVRTAGGR